ncbi:MAG: GreA/GreB family elongation factor [Lentisphaeria bacterium]|nr:GreA/GreB family elongation factor [Lentisphaeria bacterium]
MMEKSDLEDLILAVIEAPRPERLAALKGALTGAADADAADRMEMLWEEWENRRLSAPEAKFVLEIAALGMPNRPYFRKMLIAAVKQSLPPYLAQAPVVKATGVRDENLPPAEVAARMERLLALRSGAVVFLEGSRRWGVAGTIDGMNASLPMMPFAQVGGNAAVPLEIVLKDAAVLASGPDVSRLVVAGGVPISAALFRMTVEKRRQTAIPESRLKLMARSGCARNMDDAAFERYWSIGTAQSGQSGAARPGTRRACDGRSIKEVQLLLTAEAQSGAGKFAPDEIAALTAFFTKLNPATAQRESKTVAEVLAMVADRMPEGKLKDLFPALTGKVAFFPADPAAADFAAFAVWGEISSKLLEKLAAAAAEIFDEDYLAACALKLPLKALNNLCAHISDEALCDMLASRHGCGADLLLWIWKNRKKRNNPELLELVNPDNVFRILSAEEPPKAWGAARRELHGMLLDDLAFQAHLIAMMDGSPAMFGSMIQGALFLNSGERQSLLVKLARQSKEIQEYLESGAGQKILDAGKSRQDSGLAAPEFEGTYTSVHSHQALIRELDDIINVQVPENREAIATARAHGDFRENSEFDAAKERRRFLTRRRNELERELAVIQPVMMAQVEVSDTAVIGSTVTVEMGGRTETYYLLGAWDGDPDRRFLSYRTRLGKALLHRKVGDTFPGPDGKDGKLLAVGKLPPELVAELDA